MHLATDRAPCAMTADSDTPLVMNAEPADFSPAKFRKRGPPDPGGLPRYARQARLGRRLGRRRGREPGLRPRHPRIAGAPSPVARDWS